MISRRSFMAGILASAAAPAIVRADSLMKVFVPKVWQPPASWWWGMDKATGSDAGFIQLVAVNPGEQWIADNMQMMMMRRMQRAADALCGPIQQDVVRAYQRILEDAITHGAGWGVAKTAS